MFWKTRLSELSTEMSISYADLDLDVRQPDPEVVLREVLVVGVVHVGQAADVECALVAHPVGVVFVRHVQPDLLNWKQKTTHTPRALNITLHQFNPCLRLRSRCIFLFLLRQRDFPDVDSS